MLIIVQIYYIILVTQLFVHIFFSMESKALQHRLKDVLGYLLRKNPDAYKTATKVASAVNISQSNLSAALNGNERYLTDGIVKKFTDAFPELSYEWLKEGKGEMINTRYQKLKQLDDLIIGEPDQPNLYAPTPQKFAEKKFKKEVTVIPAKAQLGLQSFLYADEMMNELEKKTMKNPVQNRETFLIEVYNEYNSARDAFNAYKAKRKAKASRLLDELRQRYNVNKVVFKPHFIGSTVTAKMVTENGKYSLD